MDIIEFSNTFDTLLNSYATVSLGTDTSSANIVFDEYEKSVFLTKAQDEVVLRLYNGKNALGDSFESTEETRRYLSPLIKEAILKPITNSSGIPLGVNSCSKFFSLPEDLWFITYEDIRLTTCKCGCDKFTTIEVTPITQDEYHRIKRNPFRGVSLNRSLRLDLSDNNVEVLSRQNVFDYYVRYIKKLNPIILTALPDDLNIKGCNTPCTSELDENLHYEILDIAIAMALQSKINTNKENK